MKNVYIVEVQFMAVAEREDLLLAVVATSSEKAREMARNHAKSTNIWSTNVVTTHEVNEILTK